MSEARAMYDTGEQARVEQPAPPWVRDTLEAVWAALVGDGMWGELTVTFQGGRLQVVHIGQTIKFE